jgi:hypothetical protein
MTRFVQYAGIPYAMVGMLMALPNTPLYRRLQREGRLRPGGETGDMFAFSNISTKLPLREMVEGYIHVLNTLYDPETYFARCREHLTHWRSLPTLERRPAFDDLRTVWRSICTQGVAAPYRRAYWRFLWWVLRHHPAKLALAIAQACAGHHFITYTRDTAVPELRARLRGASAAETASAAHHIST